MAKTAWKRQFIGNSQERKMAPVSGGKEAGEQITLILRFAIDNERNFHEKVSPHEQIGMPSPFI
jgi:hypothetical protein